MTKKQQEQDEPVSQVRRFDVFGNMADRQFIRDFAKQFGSIGFEAYCQRMGWFNLSTRYPQGAYAQNYLPQIIEAQEIYRAIGDLEQLDDFASKAKVEALERAHAV